MLTVDGRCHCDSCRQRTENIYRMVGACSNCGQSDILMLFRAGDPARPQDCPRCGCYRTVMSRRLATDEEIPEAIAPRAGSAPPPPSEET